MYSQCVISTKTSSQRDVTQEKVADITLGFFLSFGFSFFFHRQVFLGKNPKNSACFLSVISYSKLYCGGKFVFYTYMHTGILERLQPLLVSGIRGETGGYSV